MNKVRFEQKLYWIFRVAVAAEFIGHGAFGLITKSEWVPYFNFVGIGEERAFHLMPWIGCMDISLGLITLLSPRPFLLLFMTFWGLWTAVLRPLSAELFWECIERAGNYGVPLAFLFFAGLSSRKLNWFSKIEPQPLSPGMVEKLIFILRWTTGLFLIGHGGLAAWVQKPLLIQHFSLFNSIGIPFSPASFLQWAGWFEIALGIGVLLKPLPPVLLLVFFWKIGSELLYPFSGAPIWEFIERGGSYAAPLALTLLMMNFHFEKKFISKQFGTEPVS